MEAHLHTCNVLRLRLVILRDAFLGNGSKWSLSAYCGNVPVWNTLTWMGDWKDQSGDTVYGTRGGSIGPYDWGVSTQKE